MPSSKNVGCQFAGATPYKESSSGKNRFKSTSITCTDSSTVRLVPVSELNTTRFTSAWEDSDSEGFVSFSSGVCPSGWNYNAIARVTKSSTVVTTALCCASGYHLRSLSQDTLPASSVVSNQCKRWLKSSENYRASATVTASQCDGTLMVHKLWAATWHASGRATLSPKPPTLSGEQAIAFWEAPQLGANQALLARYDGNDTASTDS